MDLTNLKSALPDHAKDLKLNVSTVLTPEGAPGLNEQQILATALAAAVAARNAVLLREIEAETAAKLEPAQANAARAASRCRACAPPRSAVSTCRPTPGTS
jgi:alkyl hydroperoxide reductase subunit D